MKLIKPSRLTIYICGAYTLVSKKEFYEKSSKK